MFDTDISGLCNLCLPGDEYHYVLICPVFDHNRKILLKPYFYNRPNITKFNILLISSNKKDMYKLAKFANIILKQF